MTADERDRKKADLMNSIRALDQQIGMQLAQRNMLAGALMVLDDLPLAVPPAPAEAKG